MANNRNCRLNQIFDIKIDAINLGPNLKASAVGENSSKTTVIVKGTKEVEVSKMKNKSVRRNIFIMLLIMVFTSSHKDLAMP